MNKNEVKLEAFNFLGKFGDNIYTKFINICGKTGQYDVPSELFQKRTSRKSRVLISWKDVINNKLTLEQLDTFFGGVAVEFRNNDFFDEENKNNPLFNILKERLGSNKNVSSIITIRSEAGSSASSLQRECFEKLTNNFNVMYQGKNVIINKDNYKEFSIKQLVTGGIGNEKWGGFLFVSIKGGQQDTIETHRGKQSTVFNPACEYANEEVCKDLNLVLAYFALLSIDKEELKKRNLDNEFKRIKNNLESTLKQIEYNLISFKGTLYDYCINHYSVRIHNGFLYDAIQLEKISIDHFDKKQRTETSIDLTHNEAVEKNIYYWDKKKQYILSPAQPTNVFWSFHFSNMMQQNYNLEEYFEYEKERFIRRQKLIK